MLTLTELQSIVSKEVATAMLERYNQAPNILPELGEIVEVPIDGSMLGDKGSVISANSYMSRRREGQDYTNDRIRDARTWQVAIQEFAVRYPIDRRTMSVDGANKQIIPNIIRWAQTQGEMAFATKEQFVAGMFQKGTLTAGSLEFFDNSYAANADPYPKFIYDNQPWFDTAHANLEGTTFANHVVSSALTHANLETMQILTDQTNAKNERGVPVNIQHNVLLVPVNLRATAERIVMSERVAGSTNNDVNPLRGRYKVVAWNQLTDDTDAWWTLVGGRGLKIYDSGAPRVRIEEAPGTPFVYIVVDTFFGATVADWRMAACANKAAS